MKNMMNNMMIRMKITMMINHCQSVKSQLLIIYNVTIVNNLIMVDVMILNNVMSGTMKMIMGGVFESEMHIAQVCQWNT